MKLNACRLFTLPQVENAPLYMQAAAETASDFASFPQLQPPPEPEVAKFSSSLPRYQGVMADYLARMEAAQRKAEALELQRQQHMKGEEQEEEASGASAAIVAAAAEEDSQEPAQQGEGVQQPGPQGVMGDYMARMQAARAVHEQRSLAKGKQAQAIIPDLDTSDINRTGAVAINVALKPEVTRGVNTQLAHLAKVAAELKDLAGHVGQRAEGKQATALRPRKSRAEGIRSLGIPAMQPETNFSSAALQPIRPPLEVQDFSSVRDAPFKLD